MDRDFDDPLGLMSDCHRRIERFLATLLAVAKQAAGGPLSDEQRTALDTALRYFDGAAPKHTADEEESLFPRLRERLASGDVPEGEQVLAHMERLEHDHDRVDEAHAEVATLGRRWLEANALALADLSRLSERLSWLQAAYAEHIALEDQTLFPLAAQVLPAEAVAAVGAEMAQRRGSLTCSQRKALERARAESGGGS